MALQPQNSAFKSPLNVTPRILEDLADDATLESLRRVLEECQSITSEVVSRHTAVLADTGSGLNEIGQARKIHDYAGPALLGADKILAAALEKAGNDIEELERDLAKGLPTLNEGEQFGRNPSTHQGANKRRAPALRQRGAAKRRYRNDGRRAVRTGLSVGPNRCRVGRGGRPPKGVSGEGQPSACPTARSFKNGVQARRNGQSQPERGARAGLRCRSNCGGGIAMWRHRGADGVRRQGRCGWQALSAPLLPIELF